MKISGKGSVYKLPDKDNVYQVRFNIGKDPETGKYRYTPKRTIKLESQGKKAREAELSSKIEEYRRELETGVKPKKEADDTVGSYAESFHRLRKGTLGSELSYEREAREIKHIQDFFGGVSLTELSAPIIKEVYAEIREKRLLSENELHKTHVKLSQIMKEAVSDELIGRNPCDSIKVPRPAPKERRSLSAEEAARLLATLTKDADDHISDEMRATDYQALSPLVGTLFLLDTGVRRGEMLGLDWDHVDLDGGTVLIAQQFAKDKVVRKPKSKKSIRKLSMSTRMTETLKTWKALQAEYLKKVAKTQTEKTPVVNNDYGNNLDPDNYDRWFRNWCAKPDHGFGAWTSEEEPYRDSQGRKRTRRKGYVGLTPHMLRHTQATLLIGASTDLKTVQTRLGHASIDMTLNTYSHAIEANDRMASSAFSELLSEAAGERA